MRYQSRLYRFFALVLMLLTGVASSQTQTGYIHIITDAGVRVFLDGKLAGVASERDQGLVITGVAAGTHQLRFEQKGYKPRTTRVSVIAGEVTVYTLISTTPSVDIQEGDSGRTGLMEPRIGVLQIVCLPVYCTISIPELELDNYQKRSSTLTIRGALATRYEVTIRVDDAQIQEEVELKPNTTLRLFANFTAGEPVLETEVRRTEDQSVQSGETNVQSFEVTLKQPLAVLIENAEAAYPQQGLTEAASIFEMPIEDGLTTLMSVYNRADPAQVGPIASARDYFLEAALGMSGTLVHVGGAPSTVGRIASQDLTTLDALQTSGLFTKAPEQPDPYNIFSTGEVLRNAAGSLDIQVGGTLYTPPSDAPDATSVMVDYSADYTSGFRYLPAIDQYRWVRSGADASDASGTAVTTDAVIVAQVTAFPYSGDPEGRLYLPYSGGAATLYLRGKAIPGSWTPSGGFSFRTQSGIVIDLTPFKHWILFAPESATVNVQ